MNEIFLRRFLLILLISLLNLVWVSSSRCGSTDFLQVAEDSLNRAFEKVLEAEQAGANVTSLIVRLKEAAGLLLEAYLLDGNGEHEEAVKVAEAVVKITEKASDEASKFKASALSNRKFAFKISLIVSAIGVSAFLFFMSRLWRRFKKYYINKILACRPEVADDVDA